MDGTGTEQNRGEGIRWLRWTARRGEAKAQYNLGLAYLYGEGVSKNRRWAKEWLNKAAIQGHKKAQKALANIDMMRQVRV